MSIHPLHSVGRIGLVLDTLSGKPPVIPQKTLPETATPAEIAALIDASPIRRRSRTLRKDLPVADEKYLSNLHIDPKAFMSLLAKSSGPRQASTFDDEGIDAVFKSPEFVDMLFGPFPRLRALLNMLKPRESETRPTLVEIGTGLHVGTLVTASELGFRAVSVETNPSYLADCRQIIRDCSPGFPEDAISWHSTELDAFFNTPADVAVMSHIDLLTKNKSWAYWTRHVKPGGYFIIVTERTPTNWLLEPQAAPPQPPRSEYSKWMRVFSNTFPGYVFPSMYSVRADGQTIQIWHRRPL